MPPNKDQIAKHISRRITEARERADMTQEDLGKAIGKTNVSVSDLERGRVAVSAVDLSLIAKAVDQPLDYFIPTLARIRRKRDELSVLEIRLLDSFQRLDNTEFENIVIDHVESLGRFAQKSGIRKTLDDAKWIVDVMSGKE